MPVFYTCVYIKGKKTIEYPHQSCHSLEYQSLINDLYFLMTNIEEDYKHKIKTIEKNKIQYHYYINDSIIVGCISIKTCILKIGEFLECVGKKCVETIYLYAIKYYIEEKMISLNDPKNDEYIPKIEDIL